MAQMQPAFGEHTINELTLMFRSRQINLEPSFQRHSVKLELSAPEDRA